MSKQPVLTDDSRQIDLDKAPDRQLAVAWRARVHALTVAPCVLDADIVEASPLNTADYHVLGLLSESEQPEHTLRMSEVAAQRL